MPETSSRSCRAAYVRKTNFMSPINAVEKSTLGYPCPTDVDPTPERHSRHETADGYSRVICHLADSLRVITCKDNWQWILQRRKKGGAGRPWRAVSYHRTRSALIGRSAALCFRIDPGALAMLAALPEYFGGSQ